MTRKISSRPLAIALVLVIAAICAPVVRADYKQAYQEGYRLARLNKDWEIVAKKMTEAIAENDREGQALVLTSANTQPYLPYFYLGLAKFRLGDCRSARGHWITSSLQKKAVLHDRELQWFNDYSPICELVVTIEDTLKEAQERLHSIHELSTDVDLSKVWAQDATLAPELTRLRQQLADVRQNLQQARVAKLDQQQTLLLSVRAGTGPLSTQSEALLKKARDRRHDLAALREANEAAEAAAAARKAAATPPNTTTTPATAAAVPASPNLKMPAPATTPASANSNANGVMPLIPPASLRLVANHYAHGRYRAAHHVAQSETLPDEWRAHGALLRAASAFALFYAEGQKNSALLDEAKRAVLECTQTNRSLRPSRRLYAPPFIDFFDSAARVSPAARAQP
jgi:hypothetical protein